jgi:hypothetical protein
MSAPVSPPAAPDKAGLFEDFIDIFGSPAKVFARRAASSPFLPWLIVSVLLVGLFFSARSVLQPIIDAEMQKGIEAAMKANPQITQEMMDKQRPIMQMTSNIFAVAGMPIALLILGLATWAVGKLFGGTLSYGTGLMIACYAWVPRVVSGILVDIQGLTMDTTKFTSQYQLSFSPARFLDPATASPAVLAMLGRVDLFTLWTTVLLAIGLVAAGKVAKEKQVIAGATMWVVGSLPAVLQALRS